MTFHKTVGLMLEVGKLVESLREKVDRSVLRLGMRPLRTDRGESGVEHSPSRLRTSFVNLPPA